MVGTTTPSIDLCSADEFKTFAKITTAGQDPIIDKLIERASLFIENACDRKFLNQTYTQELYSGDGTSELYLRNGPVDTSVVPSIDFRSDTSWISQSVTRLYYTDPEEVGWIFFEDRTFPFGRNNVRVTYKAGYATQSASLPRDLIEAAIELTHELYERHHKHRHLNPSFNPVDGVSQSFKFGLRNEEIPASVQTIINRYTLKSAA